MMKFDIDINQQFSLGEELSHGRGHRFKPCSAHHFKNNDLSHFPRTRKLPDWQVTGKQSGWFHIFTHANRWLIYAVTPDHRGNWHRLISRPPEAPLSLPHNEASGYLRTLERVIKNKSEFC